MMAIFFIHPCHDKYNRVSLIYVSITYNLGNPILIWYSLLRKCDERLEDNPQVNQHLVQGCGVDPNTRIRFGLS